MAYSTFSATRNGGTCTGAAPSTTKTTSRRDDDDAVAQAFGCACWIGRDFRRGRRRRPSASHQHGEQHFAKSTRNIVRRRRKRLRSGGRGRYRRSKPGKIPNAYADGDGTAGTVGPAPTNSFSSGAAVTTISTWKPPIRRNTRAVLRAAGREAHRRPRRRLSRGDWQDPKRRRMRWITSRRPSRASPRT